MSKKTEKPTKPRKLKKPNREKKPIRIFLKQIGLVWFRFYKHEIEKTKPNPTEKTKTSQKIRAQPF